MPTGFGDDAADVAGDDGDGAAGEPIAARPCGVTLRTPARKLS